MHRNESWAPLEGGDFYGCGIGSPTLFPVLDEHWYVNMYWQYAVRPDRGTRMILKDPNSDRAVVVAAGYETGPGDLSNIGGTTEETHFYLGTHHQSILNLGFAVDASLPLGPRICSSQDTSVELEPPVSLEEAQRRYPSGELYLPFTDVQMAYWKTIMNTTAVTPESVFMKVGASTFASSHVLNCLDDPEVLSLMTEAQAQAVSHFSSGDAAGESPFDRESLAVRSGRTAGWAISGTPSPLAQEIEAIHPQMALVEYGTNDMNMGLTHASAMWNFYDNLHALTTSLMAQNILPVLHTIRHRTDSVAAGQWVPTYNSIIRGIAQKHQIPFIDQFNALEVLSDHGLAGDGVHASTLYSNPCDFSESGLAYGTNRRNKVMLDWLADYFQAWNTGSSTPAALPLLPNLGDHEVPISIDGFPFIHGGNTADSITSEISHYDACDGDIDESGPEVVYEFDLPVSTAMRWLVFSDTGVDVDIHLLRAPFDGDACLARAHRQLEGTLPAGTYRLVADSYVSDSSVYSGSYLLVALECAPTDESCTASF